MKVSVATRSLDIRRREFAILGDFGHGICFTGGIMGASTARIYQPILQRSQCTIKWDLHHLHETDGIIEYHHRFEQLISEVTLPESYLASAYLAGLRSDTQSTVRMFQPQSVRQCFLVGKLYEGVHHLERSNGASEFKNSTSNQPNQKILYSPSNGFSSANSTSFSAPIDLERKRSPSADSAASLLAAITNIQPAATTAAMTSDHSPVVAMDQARSIPVSLSDPSRSRHDVQQFKHELSPSNTKDDELVVGTLQSHKQQPSAESKVGEDEQFCLSQETKTRGIILGMDPELRVCRKWSATDVESLANDLVATAVESIENAWGSGKSHSVASLGILFAHQLFDKMLKGVIIFFDTSVDMEFTLGTAWVLFAIYAPFDRGKIKHSYGFGDEFNVNTESEWCFLLLKCWNWCELIDCSIPIGMEFLAEFWELKRLLPISQVDHIGLNHHVYYADFWPSIAAIFCADSSWTLLNFEEFSLCINFPDGGLLLQPCGQGCLHKGDLI